MSSIERVYVGCPAKKPDPSYWRRLDAFEIATNSQPHNGRTLNRWRRETPEDKVFTCPIDSAVVIARFKGEEAEAAWARSEQDAKRLDAVMMVLRTPASFRPTAANRAALIEFAQKHQERPIAWWAEGLWADQHEMMAEVCAEAGLVPVVDPLALDDDEPLPPESLIYWRLLGRRGGSQRFSDHDLDTLTDLAMERRGIIIFGGAHMAGDATRFAEQMKAFA